MQFQPICFTDSQKIEIYNLYESGMAMDKIGRKFNTSFGPIKRILLEKNIPIRQNGDYRKHNFDTNFFKKIDSHEKAQILGFIAADGCIYKNSLMIALANQDYNYLTIINQKLNNDRPIKVRVSKNTNNQDVCKLQICSKEIVKDLARLEIVPKKSLTLNFPKDIVCPPEFLNSYILGYFEGDGSLRINSVKNNNHYQGWITICGTMEFCETLRLYIEEGLDIHSRIYKRHKERPEVNSYQLMFGGSSNILKFCEWIYKDCSFCMSRKHEKYLIIKNQYGENGKLKNDQRGKWIRVENK